MDPVALTNTPSVEKGEAEKEADTLGVKIIKKGHTFTVVDPEG